ncbi:MAG TPA: anhydro-N-acetylmuramic acid kinase, partial [Chitinophagaceae bacterium]|nr:anhydro-N-acetylmuramic acid kinase [Chitinophagaceae bacterium]
NHPAKYTAFDICPANRVLNMLAAKEGKEYDEGGLMAASGKVDNAVLDKLNALEYYTHPYPKSLANDFGTGVVFPIVDGLSTADALRTYVEHIVVQIKNAVDQLRPDKPDLKLLATGGGALNGFMVERLREVLDIEVVIPNKDLVQYKEALIMALIGVLRWREESNVLASVTGASRNSIGGAVWVGQEA